MSQYKRCPSCQNEAEGTIGTGAYIDVHKCNDKDHIFCNNCKNGDRCPVFGSANIWWNYDKAYTDRG